MSRKICRLCLCAISENYQIIEKSLKNTLKLNLDISKENVACIKCANNLQILLNFKSTFVHKKNSLFLPSIDFKRDVGLDTVEIKNENKLESFKEPKDNVRCCFCIKATEGEGLISLNESMENRFLVDIVEKYISKLDLNKTEEFLTCESCLEGLQNVSNFIVKCLDVEEKINKYIKIEGTDHRGHIELKVVQRFMFKPVLKSENGSCIVNELGENYHHSEEVYVAGIKSEPELDNPELIIKPEPIDCESFQEPSPGIKLVNNISVYKQPILKLSKPTLYKCDVCSLETKYKISIKRHILSHEESTKIPLYKCGTCMYETRRKDCLKEHKLTHKSPSETTMFKCEECEFLTKRKTCLKRHMCKHKNSSKATLYKCETCTYETNRKEYLSRHKLSHKSISEMSRFKCEMCTFRTKRKDNLSEHILTHKNPSEITMFKCEQCAFETKRKRDLKRHILVIHKDPSEVTMYKCEQCKFKTKHKEYLNQHNVTHKSPLEITMFKCELCSYETKRKHDLKRHLLIHKKK